VLGKCDDFEDFDKAIVLPFKGSMKMRKGTEGKKD
jgi:hypothetical protein